VTARGNETGVGDLARRVAHRREQHDHSELEQLAKLGIELWAGSAGCDAVIRITTAGISGRNSRKQG
jgi:hypothetical protein